MFSTRKGNMFALFFIVHFIVGSFLIAFISNKYPVLSETISQIALSQIILVLLPGIYYFFFFRTPVKDTLRFYKTKPINLLLSALLAISSLPIVMLINVLSQFFVKQALGDTLEVITQENYWLALLVIAVFPGLFEELIARGIIVSHYRHKKVLITSLMSGFFFGMMHLNINQFLYAFFLGFLFSIVVHLTGSIFCSMVMHFIVNGINLSLAFVASSETFKALADMQESQLIVDSMDQTQILFQSLPIIFFLVLVSAPFVGILIFAMAMVNNKGSLLKNNAPSYRFFNSQVDEDDLLSVTIEEPIHIEAFESDISNSEAEILEQVKALYEKQFIKTQPIITASLIITFIIFIGASILTELL